MRPITTRTELKLARKDRDALSLAAAVLNRPEHRDYLAIATRLDQRAAEIDREIREYEHKLAAAVGRHRMPS